MNEKVEQWIVKYPNIFGKIIAVGITIFGICLVVGAVRDWDWLYAPDGHYQNEWGMGQISRYLGRKVARIVGFVGGCALTALGGFFVYGAFFCK